MKRSCLAGFTAFVLFWIVFSSCNKIDTTDIGNDLIPAVDNVKTLDTVFDAITDNFLLPDSTIISSSEDHALGYISNDPVFGKTTAAIYAYFQPRFFGLRPFPNADSITSIDSVVLSISWKYTFGDTNSTGRFQVYEVDPLERKKFKDTSGYLINSPYFQHAALLTTHDQEFKKLKFTDSILEGAVKTEISNQMRIRLNNSFASRFLISYDTSVYKTDSSFRDKFLGFGIIPDSGYSASNALAFFNLKDTATKLNFYYHALIKGKDTALATSFLFNSFTSANIIHRNRSGSTLESVVNNGNSADDKLYIQASPGSYATIRIPGLENLSNRIIHRAELIVEKIPSASDDVFLQPDILFLDAIDSAENLTRTIQNDLVSTNNSLRYNLDVFGGAFKNNQYIFNLTRYLQGIVTRKEKNFTLRLYAPYTTRTIYVPEGIQSNVNLKSLQSAQNLLGFSFNVLPYIADGRVSLAGGNYSDTAKRVRLRIIYSKL